MFVASCCVFRDRISRVAAIDEHDFYASRYLDDEGEPIAVEIEIVTVDLIPEQIRHFKAHLEFWDEASEVLIAGPPAGAIESGAVKEALRVCFRGRYDSDQDEFQADTEFCSPESEAGEQARFRTPDKRLCGFVLALAAHGLARSEPRAGVALGYYSPGP